MNPQSARANMTMQAAAQAAAAAYGYQPAPETAARESHVPEEIANLRQFVGELCCEFEALSSRLSCVTSPCPDEAKDGASLETYRVPLAADIRNERYRVQSLLAAMRRLNQSLEV